MLPPRKKSRRVHVDQPHLRANSPLFTILEDILIGLGTSEDAQCECEVPARCAWMRQLDIFLADGEESVLGNLSFLSADDSDTLKDEDDEQEIDVKQAEPTSISTPTALVEPQKPDTKAFQFEKSSHGPPDPKRWQGVKLLVHERIVKGYDRTVIQTMRMAILETIQRQTFEVESQTGRTSVRELRLDANLTAIFCVFKKVVVVLNISPANRLKVQLKQSVEEREAITLLTHALHIETPFVAVDTRRGMLAPLYDITQEGYGGFQQIVLSPEQTAAEEEVLQKNSNTQWDRTLNVHFVQGSAGNGKANKRFSS